MTNKTVQSVRGFVDILPEDVWKWRFIETTAREVFQLYGFEEIRTPVLEKTDLFSRSVGEATDIVGKEMYTFTDRSGDSLSLRPEGTVAVARAYLEHGFAKNRPESSFYYLAPMFRHERPQHGRLRQFHQIGAELFGIPGPEADAEVIALQADLLSRLGLKDFSLVLNSLGCRVCQPQYHQRLVNFLEPLAPQLCPDCRRRIQSNPLRVLDCKEAECQSLLRSQSVPRISESLCLVCQDHFSELQAILKTLELEFILDPFLVRGLDYYTRTAFEIYPGRAGGRSRTDAISAGGRYDELISELGGPSLPAVGFALGIERIILQLPELPPPATKPALALLAVGSSARRLIQKLARELKANGFPARADLKGGSLKAQFHRADRGGAELVIIIGEDEIKDQTVMVRDLKKSEQEKVPAKDIVSYLSNRLK
ncbi:MAG: histidine--tRNA ligase [Proteobacteria bacterium]|nr:histidine--tRNA ligase [Pseudomonadota bacterium]